MIGHGHVHDSGHDGQKIAQTIIATMTGNDRGH